MAVQLGISQSRLAGEVHRYLVIIATYLPRVLQLLSPRLCSKTPTSASTATDPQHAMSGALPLRPSGDGTSSSAEPPLNNANDDPPEGWDAPPPEKEPPWQDDGETTLLLAHKRQIGVRGTGDEVRRLAFSPDDGLIAATRSLGHADWDTLYMYNTRDFKSSDYRDVKVTGDFAFAPLPDNALLAPYRKWTRHRDSASGIDSSALRSALAIHDLTKRSKRNKHDASTICAPVACSPDGRLIAGADHRDHSRINIMSTGVLKNLRTILHHTDEVTHLAFSPDGTTLVSLSTDGWARLTSLQTGRTLRRYEVSGQRRPTLLRVSPAGDLVASVWDRSVNLWYPATGVVNVYDLHAVRRWEGWPLCISPDCRYLACRTEDGFDVSDLLTGKFRGDVAGAMVGATCAAFSSDSALLAVGGIGGEIQLYDVITVD